MTAALEGSNPRSCIGIASYRRSRRHSWLSTPSRQTVAVSRGRSRIVTNCDQCCLELMANAEGRLAQEVKRLGGHFAHVRDEAIDPKHDDAAGEAWLHGRFRYLLYRRPAQQVG